MVALTAAPRGARGRRKPPYCCSWDFAHVNGICSAYDFRQEDDQPLRLYIYLTARQVNPTVAIAVEQSYKEETWPFG